MLMATKTKKRAAKKAPGSEHNSVLYLLVLAVLLGVTILVEVNY
jgi:hypothetical protein